MSELEQAKAKVEETGAEFDKSLKDFEAEVEAMMEEITQPYEFEHDSDAMKALATDLQKVFEDHLTKWNEDGDGKLDGGIQGGTLMTAIGGVNSALFLALFEKDGRENAEEAIHALLDYTAQEFYSLADYAESREAAAKDME